MSHFQSAYNKKDNSVAQVALKDVVMFGKITKAVDIKL